MAGLGWAWPIVLAQVDSSQASASTAAPGIAGPDALALLALRRWFASVTLASPVKIPDNHGLVAWFLGLSALAALVLIAQGPRRALGQFADLPGHVRVALAGANRIRRASRLLAIVVGATVLSWTGSQAISYDSLQGRDDMLLLTRVRGLGELAMEQAALTALTPLRDVAALAGILPLLVLAVMVLFRNSADVWTGGSEMGRPKQRYLSGWADVSWASGALFILYRLISIGSGQGGLPIGGCLMVEVAVVPAVMAVCDGILLAWVLTELRDGGASVAEGEIYNVTEPVALMPGAILACLAALPSRYLAMAVTLVSYLLPSSMSGTAASATMRWFLLGWGITDAQALAFPLLGLAGALAWSGGGLVATMRGYLSLLAFQGARLVFLLGLAGIVGGVVSSLPYLTLLQLPTAPWLLNAADSYAHYLTLPVGLWTLAALIELGEQSLPEARLLPAPSTHMSTA